MAGVRPELRPRRGRGAPAGGTSASGCPGGSGGEGGVRGERGRPPGRGQPPRPGGARLGPAGSGLLRGISCEDLKSSSGLRCPPRLDMLPFGDKTRYLLTVVTLQERDFQVETEEIRLFLAAESGFHVEYFPINKAAGMQSAADLRLPRYILVERALGVATPALLVLGRCCSAPSAPRCRRAPLCRVPGQGWMPSDPGFAAAPLCMGWGGKKRNPH